MARSRALGVSVCAWLADCCRAGSWVEEKPKFKPLSELPTVFSSNKENTTITLRIRIQPHKVRTTLGVGCCCSVEGGRLGSGRHACETERGLVVWAGCR